MTQSSPYPDFNPGFDNDRRRFMAACAGAGLVALVPGNSLSAAQSADELYAELLKTYVKRGSDGVNRVSYAAFRKSGHRDLKAYLSALQAMRPSAMARADAMAYWINLYNARTLDVILDHYPVKSIKDIDLGGSFFASGPWKAKLVTVEKRPLSLDNIEHDILRAQFGEPLVHYALNCASIGCPDLLTSAWAADSLAAQFDLGARAYINHPRGINISGRRFTASKIYSWYGDDFGGSGGLRSHWQSYADSGLAAELARLASPKSYVYDWALNDAA